MHFVRECMVQQQHRRTRIRVMDARPLPLRMRHQAVETDAARSRLLVLRLFNLSALPANPPRELNVLWHDRNTFGMDRTQVGVLEQADEVGLRGLLHCENSAALEAKVGLEALGDFAHEPLEGQLSDEHGGALLVLSDLTKSHSARAVAMGLLDRRRAGGPALHRRFESQLVARLLRRLERSLLRASHDADEEGAESYRTVSRNV